jgi:hypothetical protein
MFWRSHHQGSYTKISLKHTAITGCTIIRLKLFIAPKLAVAKDYKEFIDYRIVQLLMFPEL